MQKIMDHIRESQCLFILSRFTPKLNRARWIIAGVLLGIFGLSHVAISEEVLKETHPKKLVLSSIGYPDTRGEQILSLIYDEIGKRVGISIDLIFLPAKRAGKYSDKGESDGEAARFHGYHKKHPHLIQVEEPLAFVNVAAYTTSRSLIVNDWSSLRGKGLRIEHLRGHSYPEKMIKLYAPDELVSEVNNPIQALKKLIGGRTDVFVAVEVIITSHLEKPEFLGSNIRKAGILGRIGLHTFLNRKHSKLEPLFSAAIKDIKKEGLLNQYSELIFNLPK